LEEKARGLAVAASGFEEIMDVGVQLDLRDCVYGEWRGDFLSSPHAYYHFLAGLVRSRGFTRVLEVGTHYGGATTAMVRGLHPDRSDDATVVTVDVTSFNDEHLGSLEPLQRVTGDSLDRRVIADVCRRFSSSIDLLYVDSRHERTETLQNVAVYANRLQPEVIVLDDIHLNESMSALWQEIVSSLAHIGRATDVSDLVERTSAGFGVIECRRPYRWPELSGPSLAGWMGFRRARRYVGPLVPSRGKQFLHSTAARYRSPR
jgi:predicted O-methyltransferase YrrM